MIRTLRASRSLPTLRPTAISHASHPVPIIPFEFCLNASRPITTATPVTPKRHRKTTASTIVSETVTPLMEPKKRGRPRKVPLTPTVLKRSNSTDTKATGRKSAKGDPVPTIPQPSENTGKTAAKGNVTQNSNVPTAADKFRQQAPTPEATSHKSQISTSDPDDVGTRVQAIGAQVTNQAQDFANKAVESLNSANPNKVKVLLQETLTKATPGEGGAGGSKTRQESKQGSSENQTDIPAGEKNALLAALGLTGLWVLFGGRFQKKSKK